MNNRTKAIVIVLLFAAVLAVPAVTMQLKSITDSPASSNRKIPRLMIIADGHIEGIEHERLPIYGIQYWGLMNKCQSRFYEITKEYMKH